MNHRKPLSRHFPAYHPKAGQPTYFVERLWNSLHRQTGVFSTNIYSIIELNRASIENPKTSLKAEHVYDFWKTVLMEYSDKVGYKNHTIRHLADPVKHPKSKPVKVGDTVTFFIWSGKPYESPQINVAVIDVTQVHKFHTEISKGTMYGFLNGKLVTDQMARELAANDGLSVADMDAWFAVHPRLEKNLFNGQIICWSDKVKY